MFWRTGVTRIVSVIVFSGYVASAAPAAACDFLQSLFGACAQQAPLPQADAGAPSDRPGAQRRHRPVFRSPEDYKQKALSAPDGVAIGSVAHFSADETLRDGDIVVTPNGFRVVRGWRGANLRDFEKMDLKKAGLADMERASRTPEATKWSQPSKLAVTSGASAVSRVERAPEPSGAAGAL